MVDTQGLLITVVVHSANIQDRQGAKAVFIEAMDDAPDLELVWAAMRVSRPTGKISSYCLWLDFNDSQAHRAWV